MLSHFEGYSLIFNDLNDFFTRALILMSFTNTCSDKMKLHFKLKIVGRTYVKTLIRTSLYKIDSNNSDCTFETKKNFFNL